MRARRQEAAGPRARNEVAAAAGPPPPCPSPSERQSCSDPSRRRTVVARLVRGARHRSPLGRVLTELIKPFVDKPVARLMPDTLMGICLGAQPGAPPRSADRMPRMASGLARRRA